MKKLKVATAALNQIPLDWQGNTKRILSVLTEAKSKNVDVLALPELCLTGYGCEDIFLSPAIADRALEFLRKIAKECSDIVMAVGLPIFLDSSVYNAVAVIADTKILGITLKQNLAGDGIHYEPRWFKAWPTGQSQEINLGGQLIPVGDILFDINGVKIGLEICEDAWVSQRPGASLANRGADLIINPSASHFAFGKQMTRQQLVVESSRSFNVTYLYANLLGNESGRAIYDGQLLIASGGKLLKSGERFSYQDTALLTAVIDLNLNRMHKAKSFARPLNEEQGLVTFESKKAFNCREALSREIELPEKDLKEEEFTQAVSLALFDYMRKSRSKGFVVSLSGGADSAAVVILINTMIRLGIKDLGLAGFINKCSCFGNQKMDQEELERALLTCVYQGTENSSETTQNAAKNLAQEINAEFFNWNVGELVDSYKAMAESSLKRNLSWQEDDIALQNIQARVRAPGVWMLANINNALLLSTSNRSEAAVGYATMDGDTCGGLSPIAGIDKQFLRHWLRWMEKPNSLVLNYPSLAAINVQKPTAELRPQGEGVAQTDEEDLMPYEVLDFIEGLAIRDKMMPKEICELLQEEFPAESKEQISFWVKRFFRLWCRNQWKRERYAPSFHLDDKNLDPKTWCRFPILNSSFEYELAEL